MPEIGTQQGLGIRACRHCWMRWMPFVLSCSPVADASLQLRQSSGLFSAPSLHPALVLSELSPAWCPLHPPFPKTPANPAVWLSPCQRFCSAFLRVTGKSACQPQVVFPEDQVRMSWLSTAGGCSWDKAPFILTCSFIEKYPLDSDWKSATKPSTVGILVSTSSRFYSGPVCCH